MQIRTALMTLLVLGSVLAVDRTALATIYVYDGGGTGAWTDPLAWNLNSGYPNSINDKAIVDGLRVALTNVTITVGELVLTDSSILISSGGHLIVDRGTSNQSLPGKMSIYPDACLMICDDGILEIAHNNASQAIGGHIVLLDEDSRFLVQNNTTLSAFSILGIPLTIGSVEGQNENARIQIANGARIINEITIEGMMVIEASSGTATLENKPASTSPDSGVVRANSKGTLELAANLILQDDEYTYLIIYHYYPLYEASGDPDAVLQFDRETDGNPDPRLRGNFVLEDCATIKALSTIQTSGSLASGPAGYIDVDTNANVCFVFRYGFGDQTSICSNVTLGTCP